MKTVWVSVWVGMAACALATAAENEPSPWSLRLGASYREFYDVEFAPVNFRNWNTENNGSGPYGVANVSGNVAAPNFTTVPIDYIRWNGGMHGLGSGDGWAPLIGLGRELMQRDAFRLGFAGNLQYYSLDIQYSRDGSMAAPNSFTANQYNQTVVGGTPLPIVLGQAPQAGAGIVNQTSFWIRNKFNADLWVFDAGLEAKVSPVKCVNVIAAAGPTLNLANVETMQDYAASWAPTGNPYPSDSWHAKRKQHDFDAVAGVYGAVGLSVALDERWTLAALYRYDYVPEGIGTDQAEVSLNGPSGQLMLIYAF